MSRRLGIGKIRHLDTSLLWVQQAVRTGQVDLHKVLGTSNPGDALTKYLSGPDLAQHISRMGLKYEAGRAQTAPQLSTSLCEEGCEGKEVMRAERRRINALRAGTCMGRTKSEKKRQQSVASAPGMSSHVRCEGCGSLQLRACAQCKVCEDQIPSRP